jgi:galactokinase
MERAELAVRAISARDWELAGNQLYASHDSLRNDYEVSCPELDLLVQIAREIGRDGGIYGSRMTGGGFGGCTVSLVEAKSLPAVTEKIRASYKAMTGIQAAIFSTLPSRGAHILV